VSKIPKSEKNPVRKDWVFFLNKKEDFFCPLFFQLTSMVSNRQTKLAVVVTVLKIP
jgi:hypothetical protein